MEANRSSEIVFKLAVNRLVRGEKGQGAENHYLFSEGLVLYLRVHNC